MEIKPVKEKIVSKVEPRNYERKTFAVGLDPAGTFTQRNVEDLVMDFASPNGLRGGGWRIFRIEVSAAVKEKFIQSTLGTERIVLQGSSPSTTSLAKSWVQGNGLEIVESWDVSDGAMLVHAARGAAPRILSPIEIRAIADLAARCAEAYHHKRGEKVEIDLKIVLGQTGEIASKMHFESEISVACWVEWQRTTWRIAHALVSRELLDVEQ